MSVVPFEIAIPDAALEDLHARLDRASLPADPANGDWRYGVERDFLASLIDAWRGDYDWRAVEAEMNRRAHFRTSIDDVPIHFLRIPSPRADALPLLMTHGWPWTFWDFRDVLGPLSDPDAHGAPDAPAFELIVPSLPGFGFSSPLTQSGIGFPRVAELWDRLMRERLGFERYAAHGGDWGALVTAVLGHRFADHLVGVHESLPGFLGLDYTALREEDYADDERGWWTHHVSMQPKIASHMAVHSLDPQTLGYALADSPVGLAAWILERRRAWSDCDGDVERCFSKDDLLTTISIYWFTGTITSSLRFYWENARHPWQPSHDRVPACEAPTGIAVFPKDTILVPRRIAERHANVERWTVMPRGGHFAPAEQPALLVDDLRAFFAGRR
ncbi:MAG: epoxide hydrolase family protein [Myxococcota bacterium]